MTSQTKITIAAPAKINLSLKILHRRADGYHQLESLMQKLELADVLHVSRTDAGVSLLCPDSDLPADETNLAWQAAASFLAFTGIKAGVDLLLEKHIPVAAGLGGGSSDAAAVLLALNQLFVTNLSAKDLLHLAIPLGADVPFFMRENNAAWARGVGELLTPADNLPPCWIVLVNPGFKVATKWVYENYALTSLGNPYKLAPGQNCSFGSDMADSSALAEVLHDRVFNDLESVTIKKYPELDSIKKDLLADAALCALMSGSGPTVFGIFADEDNALASAGKFRDVLGANVFVTRPLGSHFNNDSQ